MDPQCPSEYFYCELTGSVALDIFDFRTDASQKDASDNFGGMPTGGILGEEVSGDVFIYCKYSYHGLFIVSLSSLSRLKMGLGKTVIAIALILSNPPPKEHRLLPSEHLWSLEGKSVIDHPAYQPPPSVVGALASSAKNVHISNGTLVIVPMTLLR